MFDRPFDPDAIVLETDTVKIIATNKLFGIGLFAWYVITIDKFNPDEIEGILLTPPFEISGPYETGEGAISAAYIAFDMVG